MRAIALQDNINATINKQQQQQEIKEKIKLDDKIFEYRAIELLQKTILAKMDVLENKADVYNLMIKNEIVNDIIKDIQDGSILVNKNSKYKKEKQLKYLLLSNYERNAKKCLQLQKQKDKEATAEAPPGITTEAPKNKINYNKILKIILIIALAPIIILFRIYCRSVQKYKIIEAVENTAFLFCLYRFT